jgi:threonine dehydrogenase-like Zn-dependent dehydrogenase
MEATKGRGAESVIEAVGADATIVEGVNCTATGGTMSVVGVNLTMDLAFPMGLVFLKSMTLRTIFAPIPSTWRALVPLVQEGRFTLAETFTHHLGLSEAPRA